MKKIVAMENFIIVTLLHCIDGNNQSRIAETILAAVAHNLNAK